MALIGRLFVILFGFLAACLVAGMIVVGAVLFPEFSDLATGPIDQSAVNVVLGFGFIFVSGFALLPAMIVAAITDRKVDARSKTGKAPDEERTCSEPAHKRLLDRRLKASLLPLHDRRIDNL